MEPAALVFNSTFTGCIISSRDHVERHFINGAYGREGDLPSVINPDGTRLWYAENPKRGQMRQRDAVLHRGGDLPAVIKECGDMIFYQYGKIARESGPAMILADGTLKWYEKGECVRVEQPLSTANADIQVVVSPEFF